MLIISLSYAILWQPIMEEISYSGGKHLVRRKLPRRLVLFASIFAIVLVLLGGVVFFVTRSSESSEEEPEVAQETIQENIDSEPEITETPTPTPIEEPELDKTSLRIAVQNGSGEAGVASKVADVLRSAGYNVVSTGNAENFDFSDVTINVKSTKKAFLSLLENDLGKTYTISKSSSDLTTNANYDALVIIGK